MKYLKVVWNDVIAQYEYKLIDDSPEDPFTYVPDTGDAKWARNIAEHYKIEFPSIAEDKKLAYVRTQIEEMEAIIRRNEVDNYINENAKWDDYEKEEVESRIKDTKKQNVKLAKAVEALNKLQSELTK